ncbi:MAG TPA: transcriptional regulator [Polyangiaceae bacterium]|nr:transcriptional regulator [Polyangiaceae bacterium]
MKQEQNPGEPVERGRTIREEIAAMLRDGAVTAAELSARIGVTERDLPEHLAHLERSLRGRSEQLVVLPARCVRCGFVFEARTRHKKPSRCPRCKSERIEPPRYSVAGSRA